MNSKVYFYIWLLKRDKMICDNIRLVPFIYNKYFRYTTTPDLMEDLIQMGYCGLIKAVDNYNDSLNVKFSAFASNVIRQLMLQGIKKMSFALGTRNKRSGEIGECNALPFSHFDTQDKSGEIINIIETQYYEEEDIGMDSVVTKTYNEFKNNLSGFDLAVLERLEKGMRQVDIAKELRTNQKKVSTCKVRMQNELKSMLL